MGNAGTTITGTLILGALVLKASDLVKYVLAMFKHDATTKSDGLNGVLTLLLTALLGVVVVWGVAQTQWADEVPIGAENLGQLGFGSVIVLGLVISSFGSFLYDVKKAVDKSDSASTPRIEAKAEERRVAGVKNYFSQSR